MKKRLLLFIRRKKVWQALSQLSILLGYALVLLSLAILVLFIYRIGYVSTSPEKYYIIGIYHWLTYPFLFIIPLKAILNKFLKGSQPKPLAYILLGGLFVRLFVPSLLRSEDWISRQLGLFFGSGHYIETLLVVISTINLSLAFVHLMRNRISPSRIIIGGFFSTILFGAGLLLLPNATTNGISVINALFVSTSAVCVTGLTPIAVDSCFTPMGHFFLLLLIQVGGIGVMTLTSFFVFFFIGHVSVYSQLSVKESIGSQAASTLTAILKRIIGITFTLELLGAFILWNSIHGQLGMTLMDEFSFSIFHSISAFCNAGFSTLPNNLSSIPLNNHLFFVCISFLIILGGIGFPVLSNSFEAIMSKLRKRKSFSNITLYQLNTKIAIRVTLILLATGSVLIGVLEWDHAFSGLTWDEKIVQSFFTATSPRTAGFNSLPMQSFTLQTTLFTILLMWIGGGSQSTAGGVKTNTIGAAFATLRSVVRRKEQVELMGREIPPFVIKLAFANIVFSILFISVALFALTFTENNIPILYLLYEVISGISTVGLSLDTTPLLSDAGKIIVILTMFFGRVGIVTIMWGVFKQQINQRYRFPKDQIIIN